MWLWSLANLIRSASNFRTLVTRSLWLIRETSVGRRGLVLRSWALLVLLELECEPPLWFGRGATERPGFVCGFWSIAPAIVLGFTTDAMLPATCCRNSFGTWPLLVLGPWYDIFFCVLSWLTVFYVTLHTPGKCWLKFHSCYYIKNFHGVVKSSANFNMSEKLISLIEPCM